ncbi:PadR family transcriptional regulator [Roseateles sp. SL47]|uniref:PadR family transcriptional regulator n=1 Tax=Roseateles sp. SL47 TaxID=2995138 RepID=UPI00226EFD6B|nr:PadR family transcriptional regulator [Roseateles sp. SL47]WAC74044.1 PadR family transcriptional regulator [Roseateles sp. SL47]
MVSPGATVARWMLATGKSRPGMVCPVAVRGGGVITRAAGVGRHGGGPGDGSGRGGRMFEHGAIKLLALGLVAERPCYGYELIKHIEALVGGDYSPSPGVIYPTLTYLVDMGWATIQDGEGGRKQYTITSAGLAQLAQQGEELQGLKERLQQGRERMVARRSPDIERAMGNLKAVLHQRFADGQVSPELTRRIAALIDDAASTIQQLEAKA